MAWNLNCRPPMPLSRARSARARGFTLVELLVVVAMVGILAALAIVGYRKWVAAAGTAEAMAMIQLIRHGETQYKADQFVYLGCSASLTAYYPMQTAPTHTKYSWTQPAHPDYACWQRLNVQTDAAVRFGYSVMAGGPNDAVVQPAGFGANAPVFPAQNEPWFVVQANGDRNGDGVFARLVGVSWTNEIYMENDTE